MKTEQQRIQEAAIILLDGTFPPKGLIAHTVNQIRDCCGNASKQDVENAIKHVESVVVFETEL